MSLNLVKKKKFPSQRKTSRLDAMERLFSTNKYTQNPDFERSFGTITPSDVQYPMKQFLESDYVDFHPHNKCFQREFFFVFDTWCRANGYAKVPHQNYTFLWGQYRIKTGRGKKMFGVSVKWKDSDDKRTRDVFDQHVD